MKFHNIKTIDKDNKHYNKHLSPATTSTKPAPSLPVPQLSLT